MLTYLPPILHNEKLNTMPSSDFNYQNTYISYLPGDLRYVINTVYISAQSVINASITTLYNCQIIDSN